MKVDTEKIHLFISETLEEHIEVSLLPEWVDFQSVTSKTKISKKSCYSILVLNRQTEGLYKNNNFEARSAVDAISYYDPGVNTNDELIFVIKTLRSIYCRPGVLNGKQIKTLMKLGVIVYDGEESRVETATYTFGLDKEYCIAGVEFKESVSQIDIPPLGYVVVCSKGSVNLPNNVCGTFDLKVKMFYEGLILSNGPQIYPGYRGRLFCILFNPSARHISLLTNQKSEVLQFQAQALVDCTDLPYSGSYQEVNNLKDHFQVHPDKKLNDVLFDFEAVKKNFRENHSRIENIEKQLDGKRSSIFNILGILAILVAILGIVYTQFKGWDNSERIIKLEKSSNEIENLKNDYSSLKNQIDNLTIKNNP